MKIHNETDYENALAKISAIWDRKDLGMQRDGDAERIGELISAINGYEDIHYPIPKPGLASRATYWFTMKTNIGAWMARLIWK